MDERRRVKWTAGWQASASLASIVISYNTGTYAKTIIVTVERRMLSDDARAVRILVDFRGRPAPGWIFLPCGYFGDMIQGSTKRECGGKGEGAWRAVPHLRMVRPGRRRPRMSRRPGQAHAHTKTA